MFFSQNCKIALKLFLKTNLLYLCELMMNGVNSSYNSFQISTAVLMIVVLLWFTMSTPVIYQFQLQENAAEIALAQPDETENGNDFTSYPFSSNSEEKTESNSNGFSEYLHDLDEINTCSAFLSGHVKCHSDEEYLAYHGKLLSPPPKA
jgi:hypothetical protein